ncbi:hypothetical protein [Burkholderia ubonensis]|nr:hypothetical protein [Burkholderia ubonensis]MDY7789028.1 hypothetical protein [Burkholderia ubonensis]
MQTMLSPHEIATLMMVWDAPDQIELDRDEVVMLLEHHLIALDQQTSAYRRVQITEKGHAVLKAVSRIR